MTSMHFYFHVGFYTLCAIKIHDNNRKNYTKCNSLPSLGRNYFGHVFTKGTGNIMYVSIKKILINSQNFFGAARWLNMGES